MSMLNVNVKRLDPTVELPAYAYEGDAGLDLRANESVDIAPFERVLIPTGLAISIPDGYAGFVQPGAVWLSSAVSLSPTPRGSLMPTIAVNLRSSP